MIDIQSFLKNKFLVWTAIILNIVFLIVIIYIVSKPYALVEPYQAVLEQNKLNVEGLELKYILSNDAYANLLSDDAYVDILDKSVDLENVSLYYFSNSAVVDATADKGTYKLERFLTAEGNIKGKLDENLDFYTNIDGVLNYDYKEGVGEITNGVYVNYDNSSIFSESATFDYNQNYIYFKDNVTVVYNE